MSGLYLTIDDGPSEKFEELVDFLHARTIPAVFFNRGDYMDARPDAVLYGIERGFIMANHTYSHRRASQLSYEQCCDEILRTDEIIEKLYARAGVKRTGKYFRFPYMDRGMGPCLVEPSRLPPQHKAAHDELLSAGLGHVPAAPAPELIEKKNRIQKFLKDNGYTNLPVREVTVPWYAETEIGQGVDSLCTFSTSDWALLDRHKGRHGFSTIDDLKALIDRSPFLNDKASSQVVLAHDQAQIHDITTALVGYFETRNFKFLDFATKT